MGKHIVSYKQKISKLVQNLHKLNAQSISLGKKIPNDILLAKKRLEEYLIVLSWLRDKGLRYKDGKIVPMPETKPEDYKKIAHKLWKEFENEIYLETSMQLAKDYAERLDIDADNQAEGTK